MTSPRAISKSVGLVVFSLLGVCVLFLLVEGLCSSLLVVRNFVSFSRRDVDMAHSTEYDGELGWVNVPNFYSKDFYNPGVYVQTNSQGFRNQENFSGQVPPGKLRIICSGDSFTFGIGVDNDHTWCGQLASVDHRLQAVNMGVPGYGVDQIYLMYLRAGARLDYDAQIFAVITDDFRRMQNSSFLGYSKPMLVLQGDRLVVTHVPVPKKSAFSRWLSWNGGTFSEFKSVSVLQSVLDKFHTVAPASSDPLAGAAREVTARIIESLRAANRQKKGVLVVVFLPTLKELTSEGPSGTWRALLRDESAKQGVAFVDLLAETQKLPIAELQKLYIPYGSQRYMGTAGHLSDYGNEYVGRTVYQALTANPDFSARLSQLR